MASSVADRLSGLQGKPLAASLRSEAKPLRTNLEVHDGDHWLRQIGKVVERAIVLADLTAQEVTYLLELKSQATVSKWRTGKDRPHFDRLMSIDKVRPWLPIAFGEVCGNEVEHTVKTRRRTG